MAKKAGYTLIITEKPNASKKIAEAIADGKPKKVSDKGVNHYELTADGKKVVVACAVGHLYGLAEKEKSKGFTYPTFEIHWVPTADVSKGSAFSRKYLTRLKKLAKDASEFIVATDFDIEGEVIGLNCLRYACNQKDAKRMKFSTLTKGDLNESFKHLRPHLEWGMANAGETRHKLDWYYGINLSRALSQAIKKAGRFQIMSAGRVQGPALKLLVDREKEIRAFKPVPFWQIELDADKKSTVIKTLHKEEKFWDKKKAEDTFKLIEKEKATQVTDVQKKQTKQNPPTPFDLTSLQIEANRCLRITPKRTLQIAQDLYTNGYISYPRTSSQQLPESIGFKKILAELLKQSEYSEAVQIVLKSPLKPNNGKKKDAAHPAIYPTGEIPKDLDDKAHDLYRLIVRRFLATFGEAAVRETMKIIFDVKGEEFIAKGTRTVEKNWHILYGKFVKLEEEELPAVEKGESLKILRLEKIQKETQPPKRYSDATLIKELEKRNLGTKATRANIIDTLHTRKYIEGKKIKATDLGIQIADVLEKYSPRIVDEALTRRFEEEMEKINEDKKKPDEVLEEAKTVLKGILKEFKEHEKEIGKDLLVTFKETQKVMNTLGTCNKCKEGNLMIRKGKFGRFGACDQYPECKNTFSLPNTGMVKPTEKTCEHCQFPILQIIQKGKKPQELCLNADCPSKAVEMPKEQKVCPKCKKGKLVAKKSVYGAFLACDKFPKCKYTESLESVAI